MTPDQTHEILRQTLESTVEFLGGPEGWTEYNDNPPRQCRVQGIDGVYYVEIRYGPGVASIEERDATVTRVRTYLESLGMTTSLLNRTETDPIVYVNASHGPTQDLSVWISTDQISIDASSWCVPGDWMKLVDEAHKRRLEEGPQTQDPTPQ